MKTRTTINEISHDDLVNLFSTAFYGSGYLLAEYSNRNDAKEGDCFEDILARNILNGGKIYVTDHYAGGENYGSLPFSFVADEDDEDAEPSIRYSVTLDAIKKGLERAANGEFEANNDKEHDYVRHCFESLAYEKLDFDYYMADNLMQIILFEEIIY